MSNDNKNDEVVINEEHIREIVMPPYEYQKPQFGFGLITTAQPAAKEKSSKDQPATTKLK